MDSLGLTDHGSMYGAVKFYLSAREAGIKPIIGVEAYQAGRSRFDKQIGIDNDQYHLVLLAKNNTGYKNMMKLVTHANLEGYYYKPRIDMEVLSEHSEGLICLSGCLNGEVPRHLLNNQEETAEKKARQFLEIFPKDHYYFELQKHSNIPEQDIVNEKLIKLSRKLGVPLVATNDIHYMHADDAYAQEILLCIQTQHTILEAKRPVSMISSPDFYMKSRAEIELGNWILPNFEVPKGDTADSFFKKLSSQRLAKRYENVTAQLNKRLDYELDIIIKKGYSTYFLIVAVFVNWAKGKGIAVGPDCY